ncbi:MAG: Gfo/Idh/MocA family oxidoreductase, partial [Planctomycetes bacterium]|nr:Gfo/Idh/MocA family oxidoreductase [Planctomycetota bacterium]
MPTRRSFLQTSVVTAASLAAASRAVAADGQKLVIGVIGPGGMGSNHLRLLSARKDIEIAYGCDVDTLKLDKASKTVETAMGKAPKAVKDMRQIYDDKKVDAVFIATPDHWHAPATILGLDAGKHVYVEKPCSHNIREGRLMIEAQKRSGKVLQVGTQSRSTPTVKEAIDRLAGGEIGDVLTTRVWNSQLRGNIGKLKPSKPPETLDFDTWCGPAPLVDYRANLLPGRWRWFKGFGAGDIANDGVHDLDVALWGLGVTTHPSRVACFAGKYFFDDDQEWPDTQNALFEYDLDGKKKQLVFEQRIWSPYVQEDYENGCAWFGTKGVLICGHTVGWKMYGPKNKLIAEKKGYVDLPAHHTNFFANIRGEQKQLNAPIEVGHLSASLCHLANISHLLGGRSLDFDPKGE